MAKTYQDKCYLAHGTHGYYVDGKLDRLQFPPRYEKTRQAILHTVAAFNLLDDATLDYIAEEIDREYRRRLDANTNLQNVLISLSGFDKD